MNDLAPTITRATPATVRRLARIRRGNGSPPRTLSLFLDLDPGEFATAGARESQINSVFSSAHRALENLGEQDRKLLNKDLDLVRAFLEGSSEWTLDAGAVAVFCSSQAGLFEVLKVPTPVPQRVEIEEGPYIEPLVAVVAGDIWCVALVNRRMARLFVGSESGLSEIEKVTDVIHGRHEQGGWSQANYERSIEESVDAHLKHVAEKIFYLKRRTHFNRMLVGISEELWPRLEGLLHSYVRKSFSTRIDIDVENSQVGKVVEQLQRVATIEANSREKALLGRLHYELGRGLRAVSGLELSLDALNDARVEVLLIDAQAPAHPGTYCSRCFWIGTDAKVCPVDGVWLERTEDILEKALERTLSTSAEVVTIRFHDDLNELDHVAALLRF